MASRHKFVLHPLPGREYILADCELLAEIGQRGRLVSYNPAEGTGTIDLGRKYLVNIKFILMAPKYQNCYCARLSFPHKWNAKRCLVPGPP